MLKTLALKRVLVRFRKYFFMRFHVWNYRYLWIWLCSLGMPSLCFTSQWSFPCEWINKRTHPVDPSYGISFVQCNTCHFQRELENVCYDQELSMTPKSHPSERIMIFLLLKDRFNLSPICFLLNLHLFRCLWWESLHHAHANWAQYRIGFLWWLHSTRFYRPNSDVQFGYSHSTEVVKWNYSLYHYADPLNH